MQSNTGVNERDKDQRPAGLGVGLPQGREVHSPPCLGVQGPERPGEEAGDTQDACPNSHGPCPAGSRPSLPPPVGVKVQRPCPSQEAGLCPRGGEPEGGRFVCLFVCLWRRSLCALKSPLESRGQTSPSGEVVFVLLCKLEFSCGSHQNIWPLKMKTLPKNWATGVKTALSKSRQDGIQFQRRP